MTTRDKIEIALSIFAIVITFAILGMLALDKVQNYNDVIRESVIQISTKSFDLGYLQALHDHNLVNKHNEEMRTSKTKAFDYLLRKSIKENDKKSFIRSFITRSKNI